MLELGIDETVDDHPCTDVSLYTPDLDLLAYMLQDLRSMIRAHDAGKIELVEHEPEQWDVHGMWRRTVVCDLTRIRLLEQVLVVGFLAERRTTISYSELDPLDLDLLHEFRSYPGILSYSSIELADDYWANLVVHREPDDREAWRTSHAHLRAVEESPRLYSAVRIHNGHLEGGVAGNQAVAIDRTKYWDYDVEPTWEAIRHFDPPLSRIRRQAVDVWDGHLPGQA